MTLLETLEIGNCETSEEAYKQFLKVLRWRWERDIETAETILITYKEMFYKLQKDKETPYTRSSDKRWVYKNTENSKYFVDFYTEDIWKDLQQKRELLADIKRKLKKAGL